MSWDTIAGEWKQMSGKIKSQWGKLTDDQIMKINGKREELVGDIQKAYGVSKDEAERQVRDFESRL